MAPAPREPVKSPTCARRSLARQGAATELPTRVDGRADRAPMRVQPAPSQRSTNELETPPTCGRRSARHRSGVRQRQNAGRGKDGGSNRHKISATRRTLPRYRRRESNVHGSADVASSRSRLFSSSRRGPCPAVLRSPRVRELFEPEKLGERSPRVSPLVSHRSLSVARSQAARTSRRSRDTSPV
jgi:hypothetical protein